MVINISEAQFNKLFHTRQDSFLNENRESKNMKMARNVVREMKPSADPQEVITAIRNDIPNTRMLDCKFLPGVTRMCMNGEIQQASQILKLNKTLELLATAHGNEYNQDLNGMGCDELIERFSKVASDMYQKEKDELNSMNFTLNSDYEIVRIDSFEKAKQYHKYTSWCVCEEKANYDSYTNQGTGLFYFCLKRGFENVLATRGNNAPLDEYGLSMIATSVNEDGTCNTITCRWNHDNGGNDHIMTPKELSELLGANYFEVFKPYTSEELIQKGIVPYEKVQETLDSGVEPKQIFKRIAYVYDANGEPSPIQWVSLRNKMNFLYDGDTILSKHWYDYIGDEHSNYYIGVNINGKWNFLNLKTDEYVLDEWSPLTYPDFYSGIALVSNSKGLFNYFNSNTGKLVSDEWFQKAFSWEAEKPLGEGFGKVFKNGKKNLLRANGQFLSPIWFDNIGIFANKKCTSVYKEELGENLIKEDGNLVFDKWFRRVRCLHPTNYQVCWQLETHDDKFNYMWDNSKIVFKDWWSTKKDIVLPYQVTFRNGNEIFAFAKIPEDKTLPPINKWIFFDINGNLMKSIDTNDIKYTRKIMGL